MTLSARQLARLHRRYPRKRAAITGAAAGLGEALALELARHGWRLWLNDVDEDRLATVAQRCAEAGGAVRTACFDVADLDAFEAAAPVFLSEFGGVDLVFTCAGVGLGGPFLGAEPRHLREVIDVNLMGALWAGRCFLPAMVAARRGHFITIASAAAFHAMPLLSGYAASKAAVAQWSETLRGELTPHGVDVTTKMTTFYTSSIAEHTRGPEAEREKARSFIDMAPWSAADVADALLLNAQARRFYMVAPGQARALWRFKRLLPERYLRLVPFVFSRLERKLAAQTAARNAKAAARSARPGPG